MKIYKAAIIGLGPSGLAVNKLIYNNKDDEIIAFECSDINKRNNYFGFWLTDWMKPFEKLVEKKWNQWIISDKNNTIKHQDSFHPYCVISFKTWKDYCLNSKNKLTIINKKISHYTSFKDVYQITTEENEIYFAKKIYDSRNVKEKSNELIQHFFGINIITSNHLFNDKELTLMHFYKTDQLLHFIYALPFSSNSALIESTVFSKKTFSESWYRENITSYLRENSIIEYKEISSEKGIIPMFFSDEKTQKDKNIFNIGIRGDACKASTGYVFSFLIKQIQNIKKYDNNSTKVHKFIDKKMDKLFITYLKNNLESGSSFINLAKNLNGSEFQSFMMGQSNLLTKFKIIKSMPKMQFIKAIFN